MFGNIQIAGASLGGGIFIVIFLICILVAIYKAAKNKPRLKDTLMPDTPENRCRAFVKHAWEFYASKAENINKMAYDKECAPVKHSKKAAKGAEITMGLSCGRESGKLAGMTVGEIGTYRGK